MIFHCSPNFGVGAFRFIHNPEVAGDDTTLVVVCRRCVACSVRIDATSTISERRQSHFRAGWLSASQLRCLAIVVENLFRPHNGR
jgi:hypothetical protein